MNHETIKLALAYSLAQDIHEAWRNTRKKEDGTYEPRIKKSTDEIWNKEHKTDIVDIANSKFEELPKNWQYENLEAAKVAIDLVYNYVLYYEPITFEELEQMAAIVHNEWLKRNCWVSDPKFGNPKLAVSYEYLSKEEQDKDKIQIIYAQNKVNAYINGIIDIDDICKQNNISNNTKCLSKKIEK